MRPLNISSSQAKNYYYEKDPVFGHNSKWHGDLSRRFHLEGQVQKKDFLNLISGNDLNGHKIIHDGKNKQGQPEHRAAIDIPFSAPKSVSICALHLGDDRLIEAHRKAVSAVINYIEKNYVYVRKTQNGITKPVKTSCGLFATFDHGTSRADDPQLHTHTLLLNISDIDHDRHFRATINDKIFKEQKLLNSVYQGELAKLTKELGYEIIVKEDGWWKISAVKQEWIDVFSKRDQMSKDKFNELRGQEKYKTYSDEKLKRVAVLESREEKTKDITKDDLEQLWEGQVKKQAILNSLGATHKKVQQTIYTPHDYIKLSYKNLTENESTFTKQNILESSLILSRGQYTVKNIDRAFYDLVQDEEILFLGTCTKSKTGFTQKHYTSRDIHNAEQKIVSEFDFGQNILNPLIETEKIEKFIDKEYGYFTNDQKNCVKLILSTQDRYTIIQGDAGTGKTSCISAIQSILTDQKSEYSLYGLGYTGKAAQELSDKGHIESQTISSFLNRPHPSDKQILIIDESSMVGTFQMLDLIHYATKYNAKLVFIGDGKQLQSITAGRLFKDLTEKNYVKPVLMEQAIRQKTDYMIKTVTSIKEYQTGKNEHGIEAAFEILEKHGNIIEEQDPHSLLQTATNQYTQKADFKNTLIVTPDNKTRKELNTHIRNELKQLTKIGAKEYTVQIKTPVSMQGVRKFFAKNYDIGNNAFISSTSKQMEINSIKRGQELSIIGRDTIQNTITIQAKNGYKTDLKLRDCGGNISVYQTEARLFSQGEKVVFLKNDNKLSVQNGLTGTINKIDSKGNIEINLTSEKSVKFNIRNYSYIDHGYAVTAHKSQGLDSQRVIYVTNTAHKQLNTTQSFYVAISRAQYDAKIITDNVSVLQEQIKRPQLKTSTLDFPIETAKTQDKPRKGIFEREMKTNHELPDNNIVGKSKLNSSIMNTSDWKAGKENSDFGAADRIVSQIWSDKKTKQLQQIIKYPEDTILVTQPSTSKTNVIPIQFAEKLSNELNIKYLIGDQYFDTVHTVQSKHIPRLQRPFHQRQYLSSNLDKFKKHIENKQIVVVEDVLTTGGSVATFSRHLNREGFNVKSVAALMGDRRLSVDRKTIDRLNQALSINGYQLAADQISNRLTRSEAGGIIMLINNARSQNAKQKLSKNLQRLFHKRHSQDMGRDQNASGYKGPDGSNYRYESISKRVPTRVVSKTESTKKDLGNNTFTNSRKFSPEKDITKNKGYQK